MTTMKQTKFQIQQELITIRAEIASRDQMSEAVHAADNLTTIQTHEDAPSTIEANRRDRLKESSGKRISNSGQGRRKHSTLD